MTNKFKYMIANNKKQLHKVGKRWVVVSALLLGAIGLSGVMTVQAVNASHSNSGIVHMTKRGKNSYDNLITQQDLKIKNSLGQGHGTKIKSAPGSYENNFHIIARGDDYANFDSGSPYHHIGQFSNPYLNQGWTYDYYDLDMYHGTLAEHHLQDDSGYRNVMKADLPTTQKEANKKPIVVSFPQSAKIQGYGRVDVTVEMTGFRYYSPWQGKRSILFSHNLAKGFYFNGVTNMQTHYIFSKNGKPITTKHEYLQVNHLDGEVPYGVHGAGYAGDHGELDFRNNEYFLSTGRFDPTAEIADSNNVQKYLYPHTRIALFKSHMPTEGDKALGGVYAKTFKYPNDHNILFNMSGQEMPEFDFGSAMGYGYIAPSSKIVVHHKKPKKHHRHHHGGTGIPGPHRHHVTPSSTPIQKGIQLGNDQTGARPIKDNASDYGYGLDTINKPNNGADDTYTYVFHGKVPNYQVRTTRGIHFHNDHWGTMFYGPTHDIDKGDHYSFHDAIPKQAKIVGMSNSLGNDYDYTSGSNDADFRLGYKDMANHSGQNYTFKVRVQVNQNNIPKPSDVKATQWYKWNNKAHFNQRVYNSTNKGSSNVVTNRIRERYYGSSNDDNSIRHDGRMIVDTNNQQQGLPFRFDTRINNYIPNPNDKKYDGKHAESAKDLIDDANGTDINFDITAPNAEGQQVSVGQVSDTLHNILAMMKERHSDTDYFQWKAKLNVNKDNLGYTVKPGQRIPLHVNEAVYADNGSKADTGITNGYTDSLDTYGYIASQDKLTSKDFHNGDKATLTKPQRTLAYFGQSHSGKYNAIPKSWTDAFGMHGWFDNDFWKDGKFNNNPSVRVENERLTAEQHHETDNADKAMATFETGLGLKNTDLSLQYTGWIHSHKYGYRGTKMGFAFPHVWMKDSDINYKHNPYDDDITKRGDITDADNKYNKDMKEDQDGYPYEQSDYDNADLYNNLLRTRQHFSRKSSNDLSNEAGLNDMNGINADDAHKVNSEMNNALGYGYNSKGTYSTNYEFKPVEYSRDTGTAHKLYSSADANSVIADLDGKKLHQMPTPFFMALGQYNNVFEKQTKNNLTRNGDAPRARLGSNILGFEDDRPVKAYGHEYLADMSKSASEDGLSLQPSINGTLGNHQVKGFSSDDMKWLETAGK